MSTASRTRSRESAANRVTPPPSGCKRDRNAEGLECADAEPVGHARDVVSHTPVEWPRRDRGRDLLWVIAVATEQRADHQMDLRMLARRLGPQIDALEHERPQVAHRRADDVSLHDLLGGVRVLHE